MKLHFVRERGLFSWLIAWFGFGRGGFSHVDAFVPGGMLGARLEGGVEVRKSGYRKWTKAVAVNIPATPEQDAAWLTWLRSKEGLPYDDAAILGFIFDERWHDRGKWICSALQTGALKGCGLMHTLPVADSQVTPDSLYLIVTAGLGGTVE